VWPFRRHRAAGPDNPTGRLGQRGERLARKLLRRGGLKILAANYRCRAGEADLIALDTADGAETLVLVEVKTRTSDRYTDPAAAVDAEKRRRLRNIARHYLAERPAADLPVRFDIVSVLIPPDGPEQVTHIPNAF